MLGVSLPENAGPSDIFGDKKVVVDLASIPDYNLKKHHHVLAFPWVREAVAARIMQYYRTYTHKGFTSFNIIVIDEAIATMDWWQER